MEPITFVPCVNTKCTHNAEGALMKKGLERRAFGS